MLRRPLPGLEVPDEIARLVTPAEPIFTTQVRVERKKRVVYPVTGDVEIQPLRNMTDFAQVTLPDMMLRSIGQELFDFRLISGGINGLYNIDTGPAEQEYDDIIEVSVPTGGMSRKKRQKGPKLGEALKALEAEWIGSDFELGRGALLEHAASMLAGQSRS